MLEWLICAAGVAAQAPGPVPLDDAPTDEFLEFIADWDESEAAAFDEAADDEAAAPAPGRGTAAHAGEEGTR